MYTIPSFRFGAVFAAFELAAILEWPISGLIVAKLRAAVLTIFLFFFPLAWKKGLKLPWLHQHHPKFSLVLKLLISPSIKR